MATAAGMIVCGQVPLCSLMLKDCIHAFWKAESSVNSRSSSLNRTCRYREIQLLANLQTAVKAGVVMPLMIFCPLVIVALVPAISLGISWSTENLALIIYLTYSLLASLTLIIFVIGGQADVWKESKRMFVSIDRSLVTSRMQGAAVTRGEEKFWNSCKNLIKVKFGVDNYFEIITPLNCLNWTMGMTVQILLIKD